MPEDYKGFYKKDVTYEDAAVFAEICTSLGGQSAIAPTANGKFNAYCRIKSTESQLRAAADEEGPASSSAEDKGEFIAKLRAELGKPYLWGGNGPESYDCSGFAQYALALLGIDPDGDQTAHDLYIHFRQSVYGRVLGNSEASIVGDLIFFGKPEAVTHVGVALGDQEMIHAAGGGRRITSVALAQEAGAKIARDRIDYRNDRVAVLRPLALRWSS